MTGERGGREEPWRPNARFYLSDPRSAELRDVCIQIIRKANSLMYEPEVIGDGAKRATAYAEMEMLGGRLIEMGIVSDMMSGLPLEAYQESPVTTMEWIAGQLIESTGVNFVSESDASMMAQDLSEIDVGRLALVSADNMPERLRFFLGSRQVITFTEGLLDIPEQ